MSSSVVGALRVNLGLDAAQFTTGARQAQSTMQQLGRRMQQIGAAVSVIGAGIALAVRGQISAMDDLVKTADRIGIPVEALSQLQHAAELSGVEMGTLQGAIARMSRGMVENASDFTDVGIAVRDSAGAMRPTVDVLQDVADRLARMPEGAERTALAIQLLGRSGAELMPLLRGGSAGLSALMDEADALGLTLSENTARAAELFGDNLTRLHRVVTGISRQITAALLPALTFITSAAVEFSVGFARLSPTMQTFGATLAAITVVAGPLLIILGTILRTTAMIASPVLLGVAAFAALTAGVSAFGPQVLSAVAAASDAVGGFQGYIIAASAAVTAYFIPAIARAAVGLVAAYVPAIWGAIAATGTWVASLITLRGALLATGIGAFIVGAGFAINALLTLRERTGSWGEALSLLGDVARGVWAGIVISASSIPTGLRAVWAGVEAGFHTLVGSLSGIWAGFLRNMVGSLGGVSTPFGDVNFAEILGLDEAIGSRADEFARLQSELAGTARDRGQQYRTDAVQQITQGFDHAREALAALRATMADAGIETTDTAAALAAINQALAETPGAASGAAAGVDAVSKATEDAQSRIQSLAGNMSRFFIQVVQGGDSARQAISQLLSRAAEMMLNNALMSLLGSTTAGKTGGGIFGSLLNVLFNANGNVFSGSPSLSAYSGQVVSRPTMFAFAKGAGVMGEAGPEAILPLRRGSDGKLGVASGGDGGASHIGIGFDPSMHAFVATIYDDTGRMVKRAVQDARPGIVRDSVTATHKSFGEVRPA
ncbi:hypothetical protein [Pararhodobacter zhoushanensis]|uniref:Phage tail tape measure protein, lambda family n=1 Tax=Pararhodobacter zhoushanensis TaxID=2479545 RepID=A0ABT3GYH3_9RHOB|nr:hypothetical protein [Pararhodobacter zhoushanensis]MCW1932609.1 hypothetical protein [Pararhodobacter zhoushanensis]